MATHYRIRVLLATVPKLFREGLTLILRQDEGIEVIGGASIGTETIDLVSRLRPDIVLLDVPMLEMNGIHLLASLRQASGTTKALVLFPVNNQSRIINALREGVKGCLSGDVGGQELIKAIRAVYAGELWVARKLLARLLEPEAIADCEELDRKGTPRFDLTRREHEILSLLVCGLKNRQIAETLFISEKTIKTHLNSIYRKLNVATRSQAIIYAIRHAWKLNPPPART